MESKGQQAREAYAKKCSEFWDKMEQECIRQAKAGKMYCDLEKHKKQAHVSNPRKFFNTRGFVPLWDHWKRNNSSHQFMFPKTGAFKTIQENRARLAYQKASQELQSGSTPISKLASKTAVLQYYSWSTLEKIAGWAKKDGYFTRFDGNGVTLSLNGVSPFSITYVRSFWNSVKNHCSIHRTNDNTCEFTYDHRYSPFFIYSSLMEEQGYGVSNWRLYLPDEVNKTSK